MLIIGNLSFGQIKRDTSALYVFPALTRGKVVLKTRDTLCLMMNYQTCWQVMIFQKQGQLWTITDLSVVDTIYIQNRVFVPVKRAFYEMIPSAFPLFIQYVGKPIPAPKAAGYGAISETSAITDYQIFVSGNGHYSFGMSPDDYIIPADMYWLKRGTKFYKANNARQIAKFFPGKGKL